MAFFEDKRKKPVNIYKKGSPTAKAQAKMNDAVGKTVKGAANIADKYAGGAGLRKVGRAVKQGVVDPVVKPVAEGRERQKTFMANQAENKSLEENRTAPEDREAMAITYGDDSRIVGGNAPGMQRPEKITGHGQVTNMPPVAASQGEAIAAEAPGVDQNGVAPLVADENAQEQAPRKFGVDPMQAGSGMMKDEATGNVVSMGPDGKVVWRDKAGNEIDKPDQGIGGSDSNLVDNPVDIENNRGFRVGNMDVVFDDGTSTEAKKAFLTQPVRPTAQINRYDQRMSSPVQRSFGPSSSRSGKDRSKMTMGELAVDSSIRKMDNRERTVANQETHTANQAQTNSERNANERQRTFYQGQNIAGQNAARATTIAKTKQDMDQNQTLINLQDRYRAEKDPVKKKALERELYAIQGKSRQKEQIITRDIRNDMGDVTGQEFFKVDENGELVPVDVGGKGQGHGAAPVDPKQRIIGQKYTAPNGKVGIWRGNGWEPVG